MTCTCLIQQPVVEIIVCTKGLLDENPSIARWQAQNNTRERERCAYKIISMPQSRILVGQAVRSRRNIVLVVFASYIIGNSDRLVYLKCIGQLMLDGFKGDKYLGRGAWLASCQMVGIMLETSRVMMLRRLSGLVRRSRTVEQCVCGAALVWWTTNDPQVQGIYHSPFDK